MLLDLLKERRSIRLFDQKEVEQDKIDLLIEAVLRSPSSRGLCPWEFIVVDKRELLGKLANCKPHGANFLCQTPLAFVICADPSKSDVWIEDCSIAALLVHLQAQDLGLGSCWVQVRLRTDEEGAAAGSRVAEILDLPKHLEVVAIVGVGYSAQTLRGHERESLLWDRVHYNTFHQFREEKR